MNDVDIIFSLADCLTSMLQLNPKAAFQWAAAILNILCTHLTKWSPVYISFFSLLQLIVN